MMKKCFVILLAVLQIASVLVFPAAAAQTPDVKVQEWNITLGDDIGANFCLNVPAALAGNAVVKVTIAGQTTAYSLPAPNEKGQYLIPVRVAAAQMTQEITLQLVADGTEYAIGTYTVKEYAATILAGNYGKNTKALVRHMLNYGAAAQQYFAVNTDNLANAGYALTEEIQLPAEYPALTVSGGLDGIKFYGASLVMDSRVAVRYYFAADNVADVAFTANGNTYEAKAKNGLFYVEVPGILPQNYSQNILLTAQKGDEKLEISYSPLTYIVRMSEKGTATMQALVKAMYGYHQAAVSYLNNRDAVINLPAITGGTVTTDQANYVVGDTVNLTVTPDEGNVQKLYINGEPLLLDYTTGQYSFVATEEVYDITGSFEPQHSWYWTGDWDLINEAHGIAHAPAHSTSHCTGELVPKLGACNGVSVLFQDASKGAQKDYALVLKMQFAGNLKAAVRLIDRDDNGQYCLQVFENNMLGNWTTLHWLTSAENAAAKNGEGVRFGMIRENSNLRLLINDHVVWETDLSGKGVTADTELEQVKLQAYNFGYAADVPYTFLMKEILPVEVHIPSLKNGSVTADQASYMQGDRVTLTVTPNSGYSQKLSINGAPLLLDWNCNTYSFVATEPIYEITGSFQKNLDLTPADSARWDTANQSQGVLRAYYPNNTDSWWMDFNGKYQSITIKARNDLPLEESKDYTGNVGFCAVLRMTMDNGKAYGFRIVNDNGTYAYQRYGGSNSLSGWGGWKKLDNAAVALLGGEGVPFKLERTGGNQLTLSVNGVVMETYTMEGVAESNTVSSVSVQHTGNKGKIVTIPFELTKDIADSDVEVHIADTSCGKVTADRESYQIGETVTLTVSGDAGYYHNGLYVNGQLVQVGPDGIYRFVATENSYDVETSFSVGYWSGSSNYTLTNQNVGSIYAPAAASDNNGWLESAGDRNGVQALIKDPSHGAQNQYAIVLSLKFANNSHASVRLIDRDHNGIYYLQVFDNNLLGNWATLYQLPSEACTAVKNGDGVWFGLYREGTALKLTIDERIVWQTDLAAKGITAEMDSVARINSYNFSYPVEIPYAFIEQADDSVELTDVVTHVAGPNDLFYRNDNVSNLPDPFVLNNTAVDGYYYLYGTWGAFRCYRSKNLMDWELRGEVLYQYRENHKVWDSANNAYSYGALGYDLWAPEVVYDADTKLYYMFFSASPSKQGQAVIGTTTQMIMVATCSTPDGNFELVNFKDASSCGAGNLHSYSTGTYSHYYAPYLFLDPAQNKTFSTKINGGEWRGAINGREGYAGSIDPHPYTAPDGKKYLFWVDSTGADRICGVEMENWLKPKWETATVLTYYNYYTVADYQNGRSSGVSYEYRTTTNEGPFVTFHNGKYYLTYSANNWKNNSYLVAQAISDNVLGPYTKLTEAEGGIVLSGVEQGGKQSTGVGHHSIVSVGDQLFMVYHRHTNPYTGTVNDPSGDDHAKRNHAIDEIKWITVGGREVMYVNGPSAVLLPRVEKHSAYHNIAPEATVTGSGNVRYLNDGLLSHLKSGASNVVNAVGETTITGTSTFTFTFDEARTVKSIMVYNSRLENRIFREIAQIKLTCLENGKTVTKYIRAVPFNGEYYTVNSGGTVTYAEPCAAAYAIFDEQQVLSVEITVKLPAGQSNVGISEIRILGK